MSKVANCKKWDDAAETRERTPDHALVLLSKGIGSPGELAPLAESVSRQVIEGWAVQIAWQRVEAAAVVGGGEWSAGVGLNWQKDKARRQGR